MTGLTARDTELMAIAFRCIDTKSVVVDWDLFAQLGGFKNINTARTVYGQLKRKLNDSITDAHGNVTVGSPAKPSASPRKPKTPKKRVAQEDTEPKQSPKKPVTKSFDTDTGGVPLTAADHFLAGLGAFDNSQTGREDWMNDIEPGMLGGHGQDGGHRGF